MVLFVLNDVIEDGDGAFVAQGLELLAVAGNVAALLDFKPAQGHAHAAGAVGQRVGFAAGTAVVDRLGTTQFNNAAVPQGGVLPLGAGQMAQHLGAHRVSVAVGQGLVGMVGLDFGLPVALQGRQNLLQLGTAQNGDGHVSPCVSMRIRYFCLPRMPCRCGLRLRK